MRVDTHSSVEVENTHVSERMKKMRETLQKINQGKAKHMINYIS